MSVGAKAFEGFLIGFRFSVVHALLYAPYVSKEASLVNNTSRSLEYFKSVSRASALYIGLMTGVQATRQ